jgi:hypothetical protein
MYLLSLVCLRVVVDHLVVPARLLRGVLVLFGTVTIMRYGHLFYFHTCRVA